MDNEGALSVDDEGQPVYVVHLAESCVTCVWGDDTHLMGDVWCTRYGILRNVYLSCADYEPKQELRCRVTGEP